MVRQSLCLFVFGCVLSISSALFAETGVVLLKLNSDGSVPELMKLFDQEIATAIANNPDLNVTGRQELTIEDLAMGAGCDAAGDECLKTLGGLLSTDRVVFGSVSKSGEEISATIKMFDFATGAMTGALERTFPEANAQVEVPGLAETLVWGETGTIDVTVSGDGVEIFIDGAPMGAAQQVNDLSYGTHLVTARSGEEEQSKQVNVRYMSPAKVMFDFGDLSSKTDNVSSGPSLIPGIALIVLGVGGITYGVLMSSSLKSDHDQIVAIEEQYGDPDCQCLDVDTPTAERERLVDLEGKRSTKTILQFVGYGAGVAFTGVGTYLLIHALGKRGTETKASTDLDETAVQFHVGPTVNGAEAHVKVRF